jgi:glutathione S-transferase
MITHHTRLTILLLFLYSLLSIWNYAAAMPSRVIVASTAENVPTSPVEGKPTCVYWDICGLAQTIRMALALAGVDFVDVRIDPGSPNDSDYKQVWFRKKPSLMAGVLPFANLPYYMDGSVSLSQSNTILKYIGRQHGLLGPPGKEHIVDLALDQLVDLDNSFFWLAYPEGADALKTWCEEEVPAALVQWEHFLGSEKFLTGDSVTVADLKLYESLRKIRIVEKEICNQNDTSQVGGSSKMADFMKRIEAIPAIKEYIESADYMARPLNNPHALFK